MILFIYFCKHKNFTLFQMDQDENQKSDNTKRRLSIDKAAFILLRIKRVFKKRSQSQHIDKKLVFIILSNYYNCNIICLLKKVLFYDILVKLFKYIIICGKYHYYFNAWNYNVKLNRLISLTMK